MKEENSVQWLNVDVPSVLSGVPDKKKPRLPVIFGTGGESVWGPGLLAQIQARGRELKGKEREPQVMTLEFDKDYYPCKGIAQYSTLTEEKIGEVMLELSKNHPMPIVSAIDHGVLRELAEFNEEYPMRPEEMFKPTKGENFSGVVHEKRPLDFKVRTVNEEATNSSHQEADKAYLDRKYDEAKKANQQANDESDAEELRTIVDNCEFSLGDRVKDDELYYIFPRL